MADNKAITDKSFISWRSEFYRKGIHLLSLSMPVMFFLLKPRIVYIFLGSGLLLFVVYDLLRFFGSNSIKKFLYKNSGFLLRPREKKSFSGATTIVLSGLLVYYLFDLRVAAASMIIIVIGDTAAAIIGRRFGKIKIYGKTLEGAFAFIVTTGIVVYFIPDLPYRIAFSGVLLGSFVELLPIPIDDNLTVPLAAGGVMQMLI